MQKLWRLAAAAMAMLVALPGLSMLPAVAEDGLKVGEYACYGSGGSLLIGLGFKVLDGSRYDDLDGKSPGTYAVKGDTVTFIGGHLDGYVGTSLKDGKFNIRSASCEPFA